MKKITKQDVAASYANLPDEQREFMEKNADMVVALVNKALEGAISPDDFDKKMKELTDKLAASETKCTELTKANDDLSKVVKGLSEAMEKAKRQGLSPMLANKFADQYEAMMESKKMKDFIQGTEKNTGFFEGFSVKEIANITSMTDNSTGDVLVSYNSDRLASPFTNPKLNMRDVMTVIPGDPKFPSFTYLRVKNFDRNAQYVTENGRLAQSSLDVEEVSTSIRRVGTYFDLSENLLMARFQLRAFIIANIPGIINTAENTAILFGDGQKNQLLGITHIEGVGSIEDQITGTVVSGAAGDVASIESHNKDADILVTFTKPISKALSSMMITFTGATVNTSLATAHPIIKINDRQAIVVGAKYTAEEASATVKAMTFTINHSSFQSVEAPNSKDVIRTIVACLSFAQYVPSAIVLNPLTLCAMEGEKDTTGRDLEIVKVVNGVKTISGIPVIESSDMPVGYYLAGDFNEGAQLYDYSKLGIQFVRDAETAVYNMVRLVAQEQLALVVYMPWAFAYGDLATLKAAITKTVVVEEEPKGGD